MSDKCSVILSQTGICARGGLGQAGRLKGAREESGATGLHVYVPNVRNLDYDSVRAAANTIFAELASRRP